MSIRYSVFTTLKDAATLEEYVTWLKDVHVNDVIKAGGALSAEVIIKDLDEEESPTVESSYLFPSSEILAAYFEGPAAALREDMKNNFLVNGKVTGVSRRIGLVAATFDENSGEV